ncbi:kinesin-domain-containing protein [Rhizodiscina lignyota]|uniref:Kinesin-domain-containing protein n=1 Tax=Rhizodiscina lignyota TaxID=1504668 RepID=A0A9P4IDI9_9PEZI|nr:kinesin-domain-containing protein [Rhizodiscina lignyota]
MATAGGNIKVVVRVRPFNSREIDRQAKCIVSMKNNQTVLTPPSSIDSKSKNAKAALEGTKTFAFDRSYWSFNRGDSHFAGQEDLFDDLGRPLLDNAFQGYNNCIFAYGQTGSGKSYSMMGYGEEYGVIPRICKDMFDRMDKVHEDKNLQCTVEVSYLEIYNERVRDLLNPATKGNLRVREHPSTGPYVEDLAKLAVQSFQEIENLMDEGNKARTVAATNMNETSSRSHAVFTLTLTQKRHDIETRMDTEKVAKISLVDLAGSERATSTGATGARLKEGAEINRSLSTLGRVIASLADQSTGKKKGTQVPYRDSVLTWLLKDSLGGNSLTAMIAAISPADINFEETLSTLRYADSAKRIKNHAVVNEDPNARMIRELKEELAQLRAKLSGGGGAGGVPAEEQYAPDTPLEQQIVSITQSDGSVKKVSKAEIAEQLSQSEKLYKDLNQTWEEKLQHTEQIHKEREQALEDLGISIEKGFVGMSTPKKMPHLVNLSDDPLLAECLVYNLKPGATTVGNVDTATSAEIILNGTKILQDHCTFENVDGAVTVVPKDNAAVMVNGVRIEKPKRLRSGYRIILGDFHIFRFNNPQEAQKERAEQGSLLRHSINVSDLDNVDADSPSPSGRPNHERSLSNFDFSGMESDFESTRGASPAPDRPGAQSDWSFARREAVSVVLGGDQKISALTDDELDVLFEDLQRVRAGRKGRPESKLFSGTDDDSDSVTTFPIREKYASNGTLDNFSLDTVLTVPSTPRAGEEDDRLRLVREEMQTELNKQKEEFQEKLKAAEESNVEVEEIKAEKAKMVESLQAVKEEMQQKLKEQREEFEQQLLQLRKSPSASQIPDAGMLEEQQLEKIRRVLDRWQQRRYVSMAETVLRNAALLKEVQVMSQQMDKHVVFQLCVVDIGHTFASSYDLVLSGIPTEDDEDLDVTPKPCIGVRVIDFKNHVVHLWSLQKLRKRLRVMREMQQYIHHPDYKQHFRLENPFSESCLPQYSRIGDADVSLTAVFEARVQDFSLDIVSPYTSNAIGMIRISLEPSSAETPSSTMKFNVVMHDMIGFPEREGTEVHAQLFIPGVSDEGGAATTMMVKDFDEGPVRFGSVHSMSLPFDAPRTASLRIAIFAKVTNMHLDKLLSWDDMRDAPLRPSKKRHHPRLPESEFYTEEKHDIFAHIQLHEISEEGTYQPTEVMQTGATDSGAYQLHQGLQRRVTISLTQNSGQALPWGGLKSLRIGHVRLIDAHGKASDVETKQADVPVKLTSLPSIDDNPDGTSTFSFTGQWDSSMHSSPLLDRPTREGYRVQITLYFNVGVSKPGLQNALPFSVDLTLQIRPRSYVRPSSMLSALFNQSRVVHSSVAVFSVVLRPSSAKRAADLWRMDTRNDYVKGEEHLSGWTPRGVSLVEDFVRERKRKWRVAEIETARALCSPRTLAPPVPKIDGSADAPLDERQKELLAKVLTLWQSALETPLATLFSQFQQPSHREEEAASRPSSSRQHLPALLPTVTHIPKSPICQKSGFLLSPNAAQDRWVRRFVELRRPYLHIYALPDGDEINAIALSNARIDAEPQVAKLLRRNTTRDGKGMQVFAVFAPQNAWLFACRGDRDKAEWILRIDEAFMGSGMQSASGSGSAGGSEDGF